MRNAGLVPYTPLDFTLNSSCWTVRIYIIIKKGEKEKKLLLGAVKDDGRKSPHNIPSAAHSEVL